MSRTLIIPGGQHPPCSLCQVCDALLLICCVLLGKGNFISVLLYCEQSDCFSVLCVDTCQFICSVGNYSFSGRNILDEGCAFIFVTFPRPEIVFFQKVCRTGRWVLLYIPSHASVPRKLEGHVSQRRHVYGKMYSRRVRALDKKERDSRGCVVWPSALAGLSVNAR